MRDEGDHRAVGKMAHERDDALARRGHRCTERRGDVDRAVEVRVCDAPIGRRRLELERRRPEWLREHATYGQEPGTRRPVAKHRRGNELRERRLRFGGVLRESGQYGDLGRFHLGVAGSRGGGERPRTIAQPRELRLLRPDGSLERREELSPLGQLRLRGEQSALE